MIESSTAAEKQQTDTVYQLIKLFIEGIQVPFISISISNGIGQLPQARISIPPQVGLPEISRFYSPKVHIFYVDPKDDEEKVLFTGIITGSDYNKSGTGSVSISFNCVHRYQYISEMLIDYTKFDEKMTNVQDSGEITMFGAYGSKQSVAMAFVGCVEDADAKGGVEVTQKKCRSR